MYCINKGIFANVYLFKTFFGLSVFVKKFNKNTEYLYQGYNLKSLYQRNRIIASVWGHAFFKSNHLLKKYLPGLSFTFGNSLFTVSKYSKTINLETLIKNSVEIDIWLRKVEQLTLNLRNANLQFSGKKVPKYLNNQIIWKLKKRIQIVKPLSYFLGEAKAKTLADSLGKCNRISHGDLQPKNLIPDGHVIKIIDFEESFIATQDWDEGFMWGNLLYLTVSNKSLFNKIVKIWSKLSRGHNNFIIISLSVCLMRLYIFPLNEYRKSVINQLTKFCLSKIKVL